MGQYIQGQRFLHSCMPMSWPHTRRFRRGQAAELLCLSLLDNFEWAAGYRQRWASEPLTEARASAMVRSM